jgi:hypothetical protein
MQLPGVVKGGFRGVALHAETVVADFAGVGRLGKGKHGRRLCEKQNLKEQGNH